MIIEAFINLITSLLNLIPFNIPSLPSDILTIQNWLYDGIRDSLNIIDIFIDLHLWLVCAGVMIAIFNVKFIYNFTVRFVNLIPGITIPQWK